MVKRQENKDSACSRPEWQVQLHPGNNTALQKCMSGISVPVITAWRRHLKSQWHAFLLHLNICTPSSVDTIGWGPYLSDRLCLLCLISPEYMAAAVTQLHVHSGRVKWKMLTDAWMMVRQEGGEGEIEETVTGEKRTYTKLILFPLRREKELTHNLVSEPLHRGIGRKKNAFNFNILKAFLTQHKLCPGFHK